jgi:pyruvate formate lyase activating enzyme
MEYGLVFNIQKFSVHDGPGIRTTVFLKGCPLRCAWCHNPEGIASERDILVIEVRCLRCGECNRACEVNPLGTGTPFDFSQVPENCVLCEKCAEACPTGARQVIGRRMGAEELVGEILQDRVFYEESGGGVTFSGGEPLMQWQFLRAALQACRAEGLHTAVDTSGFARSEDLLAVAEYTNLFLYDLKHMDDQRHREQTGVSNRLILENLRALGQTGCEIWVRVPLIPGVNDDRCNLENAAKFAASIPNVRQVCLLPYHATGTPKSMRLGHQTPWQPNGSLSKPRVDEAAQVFRQAGLAARIGG